jgi:hypothetical protein
VHEIGKLKTTSLSTLFSRVLYLVSLTPQSNPGKERGYYKYMEERELTGRSLLGRLPVATWNGRRQQLAMEACSSTSRSSTPSRRPRLPATSLALQRASDGPASRGRGGASPSPALLVPGLGPRLPDLGPPGSVARLARVFQPARAGSADAPASPSSGGCSPVGRRRGNGGREALRRRWVEENRKRQRRSRARRGKRCSGGGCLGYREE